MKKSVLYSFLGGMLLFFVSCNRSGKKEDPRDTPTKGFIRISVDESFKPVIEEQLKVHHSSFPNTRIEVSYKSEAACFRDLQSDSTRMIIVAKGLTDKEAEIFENSLSFKPQYGILAYDAVTAIVNRAAKDSVFTIAQLKDILSGRNNITAVMDGKNATSTIRYLQDSVLRGEPLGKNVVAAQNSDEVIEVVSNNPNVIGFVGLSWVGDSYDPKQVAQLKKIRTALVECVKCEEKDLFAKPSQASLAYGQYPLARPLYYILKENSAGLGTGFMNFMSLERGQLIFRRSFLVPAKMGFNNRVGKIKESAD
ncbi:MAG: substrate-binding domain-containing protein [Chitinophagaceae bacterium]|nr:substrate-binding domain-containing protein [Chitinophagaceae bacterium]MCA6456038.1 substrate-binding domain-containing protein [Chitinophagaceae bacterium]MCA6459804.1 substrate-binding domain-containing protein [Chitinophagaceae bacterium]MCA6465913.1 substrate-binding domain-containing protein [Chitinophagaceae bacterium]